MKLLWYCAQFLFIFLLFVGCLAKNETKEDATLLDTEIICSNNVIFLPELAIKITLPEELIIHTTKKDFDEHEQLIFNALHSKNSMLISLGYDEENQWGCRVIIDRSFHNQKAIMPIAASTANQTSSFKSRFSEEKMVVFEGSEGFRVIGSHELNQIHYLLLIVFLKAKDFIVELNVGRQKSL